MLEINADDGKNFTYSVRKTSKEPPKCEEKIVEELKKQRHKLLQKFSKPTQYFKISSRSSPQENDEQVKFFQIFPFIPDEVIRSATDYSVRSFEAAVFFADISGFTDLSDKFQHLENGASKLSMVLNFYLSIMVKEILSHNGDLIKYGGDAFLAIFRSDNLSSLQNSVHSAIDTAIIIQKNCKNFLTEVGVVLNVKIAISCGDVFFSLIGNEQFSHYAIVGEPVWQVKNLQEIISPGEILLTLKAWFFTQESYYNFFYVREHRYYKITGFKDQTNIIRQQYEANLYFNEMQKGLQRNIETTSINTTILDAAEPFDFDGLSYLDDFFSLRPSVKPMVESSERNTLRRYMISPLLNIIDKGESIDTLCEMRQVVIVFVNFIVHPSNSTQLLKTTNKIFIQLNSIVTAFEGTLNKVSLFDKDMMFLNIFGLRGFKHANDAEIALRCAFEICETFKVWREVEKVSIGVTSGMTYCGIVGHSLRREYSAISVTVNRAARLMIAYPGIVSCDQETLMKSKIDLKHFKLLPLKSFKGLHGNVLAYRFQDIMNFEETSFYEDTRTVMYDREELLTKIQELSAAANDDISEKSTLSCFIIKGSSQQGKSSVMKELYRRYAKNNVDCIKFTLNRKHFSMPFWTVRNIFVKILEKLDYDKSLSEFVTDTFSNYHVTKYLAALNSIFDTHFESSEELEILSEDAVLDIQRVLMKIICSNLPTKFSVILIDDADFMDASSLNLLASIIETKAFFLVLTIGKQCKKWTLKQKQIYMNERVTLHKLQPIDKTFFKNIACQIINVSAIPIEFERFLHENSDGNPGWIETCTKTLLYADKLEEVTLSVCEARLRGMVLIEKLINQDIAVRNSDIINAVILNEELHPSDYAGIDATNKLIQYDALSSFQDQLVCRCASVLGTHFNRNMLNYLMPECKDRDICKSIVQLFQLNIFACASPKHEKHDPERVSKMSDFFYCCCQNVSISDSCRDLPRYSCCSFLKFQDDSFRQCVYDTLTERQRLDYHRKCFSYLYRNTVKCDTCGNRQFEVMREIEVGECDGCMSFESTCADTKKLKLCDTNIKSINDIKIFPIVLNYAYYNFMNCKCNFILDSALNDIIEHCRERDMIMKLLYSKVLRAEMSIRLLNYPLAVDILQKASEKLKHEMRENDDIYFKKYLKGKVLILQGICAMEKEKSLEFYYEAASSYGINFPRKFGFPQKVKLQKLVAKIKKCTKSSRKLNFSRIDFLITEHCSMLLQLMSEYFMTIDSMSLAKLAAFWALKKALKYEKCSSNVIKCFTNAINICRLSATEGVGLWLQQTALHEIWKSTFYRDIDARYLGEIFQLYTALMNAQFNEQKACTGLLIGEYLLEISYNNRQFGNVKHIVPSMFLFLLKAHRIEEAQKLLDKFLIYTTNIKDMEGLIWHYTLCMDLYLDTACKALSYEEYDAFLCEKITHQYINTEAYSRFIINFCLWSVRDGMLERWTELWEKTKCVIDSPIISSSSNSMFICIRVMEILTCELLMKIENGDASEISENYSSFSKISKVVAIEIKNQLYFATRFKFHLLHYKMITNFKRRHLAEVKSLTNEAFKNNDFCTLFLIKSMIK